MRQEVEYLKIELTECVTMKLMKTFARLFGNVVLSLFIFGCTVQRTPSLLTSTTSGTEEVVKKINQNVPFAYDLAVDTVSYNSCVGIGLNNNGLHGLKLGANEGFVDANGTGAVKGGIKLRSDFLNYLANNVEPIFPNTRIVASQVKYILQNSTNNQSSPTNPQLFVQYAVRQASDLSVVQDLISPQAGSTYAIGRDGVYEYTPLTDDAFLDSVSKDVSFGPNKTVLSEGARVFNIGATSSPKAFEASLGYSKNQDDTSPPVTGADDNLAAGEQYSDQVRTRFSSNSYVLAVTYGNPSTVSSTDTSNGASFGLNSPKRKLNSPTNRAYGRSFELSFTSKNAGKSSQRKNILNKVIEKNLEDGVQVSGVSWTCDNVVIMKTSEWNNKKVSQPACSELVANDLLDPTVKDRVAKLRRHYPESLWGIGLFYDRNTVYSPASRAGRVLCLVNKAIDCYLPTVGLITSNLSEDVGVQYNTLQDCYLSRYRQMGVSYNGNVQGDAARRLGRCPQYASICVRSSTSY